MKWNPALLSLGAALALAGATPAHTTPVYVTYEGTVTSSATQLLPDAGGLDVTGLFGGGNLLGKSFTATFVFDVVFGLNNFNFSSSTESNISGGSQDGTISPSLGVSLTIAGHTETIVGASFGQIYALNGGGPTGHTMLYHAAADRAPNPWRFIDFSIENDKGATADGLPANLVLALFNHPIGPDDISGGRFCDDEALNNCLFFTPSTLRISTAPDDIPNVPIPAALPLFATGLGAIGFLAYRRKREVA